MSTTSSLKAALERRDAIRGARQSLFDTPIDDVLIETATLPQPVEVARVLKRHGLSLRKAHEALILLRHNSSALVSCGESSATGASRQHRCEGAYQSDAQGGDRVG